MKKLTQERGLYSMADLEPAAVAMKSALWGKQSFFQKGISEAFSPMREGLNKGDF